VEVLALQVKTLLLDEDEVEVLAPLPLDEDEMEEMMIPVEMMQQVEMR